jgi:hypothetical protein
MFEKKMLTLCCAIGILAFGACFLPPLPQRQPPPPPIRSGLRGLSNVEVAVANQSESRHLDAFELALQVAGQINALYGRTGVRAFAGEPGRPADAVLKIDVLHETATLHPSTNPSSPETWEFEIALNATLTRTNGEILWQRTKDLLRVVRRFPADHPADLWSEQSVHRGLAFVLGDGVTHDMFYGH